MQHTQLTEKKSTARDDANKGYLTDLGNSEYDSIGLEIEAIDKSLNSVNVDSSTVDNTELIERRKKLLEEQYRNKRIRDNYEQREKCLNRISEIEQERLVLLDKLSANEKIEFELSEYIKRQVDSVENSLSNIFKGVSFKMFDVQINQGLTPTCVVLRDGVPYSDLNTASKIWVSLEIINVLSGIYKMQVPVFIDNRESVTDTPDVDSQIVNLYVSKSDKKLKIK
jgi:exonuclease SbcC